MAENEETTEQELEIPQNPLIQDVKEEDVDSRTEWWFIQYLLELWEAGVVLDAERNIVPITLGYPVKHRFKKLLKTKAKAAETTLLHKCEYTPDFNIRFNPDYENLVFSRLNDGAVYDKQKVYFITTSMGSVSGCTVEIKADHINPNELRYVNLTLKWLFDKYGYYVNTLKIPKLFDDTFYPKAYLDHPDNRYKIDNARRGIKAGDSKIKNPKLIDDYLKELEEFKIKPQEIKP